MDLGLLIIIIFIVFVIAVYYYVAHIEIKRGKNKKSERKPVFQAKEENEANQQKLESKELKQLKRKCPKCGRTLGEYSLKCEKCGEWVDNEVFRKLCDDDVELIKVKDLIIATPSLICLMLLNPMKAARQELEDNEKTVDMVYQFFFRSYCYSYAVNLAAKKKKGRESSLKTDINIAIITQTKSLIEERSTVELSDRIINHMLDIFNQLDKINEEFPYTVGDPAASEFLVAQRMGEIIYKEKNTIYLNMELYTLHKLILAEYRKIFSKLFTVEEEDFDWRSIIEQKD